MVCNSCGAQNPDDNLFCMKCGKQITPAVQQQGAAPGLHHVTERKLEGREIVNRGNNIEPGDTAFLTKDIYVEGQLAFSDNEKVIVERIHASDQRSDYKYVVVSKRLLKRFQLGDEDLRMENKEAIREPVVNNETLNEMLKIQKKTYATRKTIPAIIACAVALVAGVILIGIVLNRYSSVKTDAGESVPFGDFLKYDSGAATYMVIGSLAVLAGLLGLIATGIYSGVLSSSSEAKKKPCPYCGALIPSNALFCRYCKKTISPARGVPTVLPPGSPRPPPQ